MPIFTGSYHEQDPRWTAIDEYITSHLHVNDTSLRNALDHCIKNSFVNGLPDISVSPTQGKFLMLQCRLLGVKNVLEVGTLGGYSAIYFAAAKPDIRVVTIEIDGNTAQVARDNIRAAGFADRVEVIVGAGVDVLPRLAEEIKRGERERFGLTFIDADKENNWNYFNWGVELSLPGAAVFVDNVVRQGDIMKPELFETDSRVKATREVVERVGKDSRVDATVVQTVGEKNYDGFLLAIVKGKAL